jgi:hypothetical protein
MYEKSSSYCNAIYVLLIALSLLAFSGPAYGEISFYEDSYGPAEKKINDPINFNYSLANDLHRATLQGKLVKRVFGENEEEMFIDLKAGYGRFFSPSNYGYLGFGYFSAKLDTDNRLRLSSSLGRFLPVVDGELFLTHRFLRNNLCSSLQNIGPINEKVYENSFSAKYSRYTDGFLRETSLNYSFSIIPGQDLAGSVIASDPQNGGHALQALGGFSDTTTHEFAGKVAFGSEDIDLAFLSGFKTSLFLGYEYVEHDAFHQYSSQSISSLSALATFEQLTPVGLIKTSYKHVESSRMLTTGYSYRGIELYYTNIQNRDYEDARLFGFKINFDLNNLSNPLPQKTKRLFHKAANFYKGFDQMRHNSFINSDSLASRPQIRETIKTW